MKASTPYLHLLAPQGHGPPIGRGLGESGRYRCDRLSSFFGHKGRCQSMCPRTVSGVVWSCLPVGCALVNQIEGCLFPRVCVCPRVGDGFIFVVVFSFSYANTTGQSGGSSKPIFQAVAYVHKLLIAHTDIKPANICFQSSCNFPVP